MRRLLVLPVLLLLASCIVVPRPFQRFTGGAELQRKKVVDKRDPNWLVAYDGSTCSVSKDKYDHTATGDVVFCAWRDARTATSEHFAKR